MLDIQLIRDDIKSVEEKLKCKGWTGDLSQVLVWDVKRREIIKINEELKAKKNTVSASIPSLKKQGQDVSDLIQEMSVVGEEIKKNDEALSVVENELKLFMDGLPNLPADDVVPGGKENNQVVSTVGEKPHFDFEAKHHVDLVESLGIVDYGMGAKLSGSGFWVYTHLGAQLEWALLNYFISEHLKDGYEMMLVPHILNYRSGYTAGQFPKFDEDVFWLDRTEESKERHQFILPTAETALVNLYRDDIISEDCLPKKLFAYTPCYRKEAGSYRAEERGMIRGHQFNKIEMFQYTRPEDSDAAFEELVDKAANLVKGLDLHYRVSKLAAEDCSAAMAKTYDIEIWIPSMNDYKEVSSASNARDYQARRGNMRFRRNSTGKPEFMHTLNASGLATSRIFPAIIEQYQQKDGSVIIPEVLRPFMGGLEKLEPKK